MITKIAEEHQFTFILKDLQTYQELLEEENKDSLWEHACSAPHRLAAITGDFFLQIIA